MAVKSKSKSTAVINSKRGNDWMMYHGDCVEVLKGLPDNSIDFSVYSPPFSSLYTYSASVHDHGNVRSHEEFFEGYRFMVRELFRVMKPGCNVSVHSMILPTSKQRDGHIGLYDFPGDIRRCHKDEGFIFHSEVVIRKDPVTAMQRTKALGLLHKQIVKNSAMSRQGIPDYLTTFRKPGDRAVSVEGMLEYYAGTETIAPSRDKTRDSINVWQRYAEPVYSDISSKFEEILPTLNPEQAELFYQILEHKFAGTSQEQWMDINPSDTLQYQSARANQDERHICLARDSRVLTRQHGYKAIQDIDLGDLVLTHKGRWMPVIAKQKTSESADVVAINAGGVSNLTLTPTHKLWAKNVNMVTSNFKTKAVSVNPSWVEAQNAKKSYLNLQLSPIEDSDLTAQEWWIIGRWIADGHLHTRPDSGRTSLHISGGNHKLDYLMESLGDYAGTNHSPGSTCTQVRIKDPDRRLRDVIERCGKYAHLKQIPVEAYGLCHELAASFLDGFLSGDGHFQPERQRWYVTSTSKDLLLGLQFIVQRVYGVTATLHAGREDRVSVIQGRNVNARQEWVMSFQTHGYSFNFVDNLGAWKKVKSIEPVGKAETWNIQVLEDASYTAEGCIVKNCPLQLQVIERALQLWSNPGEVVLSPYAGIGSELYQAVKMGRKAIGAELKDSYFACAAKNLSDLEASKHQMSLFSIAV